MDKLKRAFKKLLDNKSDYVKSKKGKDFEERIENLFSEYFTKITKEDYKDTLKNIKKDILEKTNLQFIENTTTKRNHFVMEPFGSQSYPDIIIFSKKLVSIEIKFTEHHKPSPFWNSGIPRLNGVYIFGSYDLRDLTFFLGQDTIDLDELKLINDCNEKTDKIIEDFNKNKLKNQKYGFHIYNRKAYQQGLKYNKEAITNFFDNKDREKLENKVLNFLSNF